MKERLLSILDHIDDVFVRNYLRFFVEKNALLIFVFHNIFRNQKEIASEVMDPQQEVTLDHFRRFIEYYLELGYGFISPDKIISSLNRTKKYVLLTFDDGYFNNIHVLPSLREYKIPALFFISANHVRDNKSFWWDALYRGRKKQGYNKKEIYAEGKSLKTKKTTAIELYLKEQFGDTILIPVSDIDRPFSPSELKDFSNEKYVFVGNHTCDHAILTNYSKDEIKLQIEEAQKAIYEMTGILPSTFAYPDGRYTEETTQILKDLGFHMGMSSNFRKNYLSNDFGEDRLLTLNRFYFSSGSKIAKESQRLRADISPFIAMKNIKNYFAKKNWKQSSL